MKRRRTTDAIIKNFKEGSVPALSRLITCVENDSPLTENIMDSIYPLIGKAHIVGITGPPGAGKSTLVDKLIRFYRQQGFRVGVLCVDPSSIYSGGAFLGDRIRMGCAYEDKEVYLRSLATRGALGGLAPKIGEMIKLLDAFGKDLIIVETVGVGQMEADIINYADTKIVLSVPGLGDQMQTLKAGIIEIADIFVVNKADIAGALDVVQDLEIMLQIRQEHPWIPDIVLTEAVNNKGIAELYEAIQKHRLYLQESGMGKLRSIEALKHTCVNIVLKRISDILLEHIDKKGDVKEVMDKVRSGKLNPYRGANEIIRLIIKINERKDVVK